MFLTFHWCLILNKVDKNSNHVPRLRSINLKFISNEKENKLNHTCTIPKLNKRHIITKTNKFSSLTNKKNFPNKLKLFLIYIKLSHEPVHLKHGGRKLRKRSTLHSEPRDNKQSRNFFIGFSLNIFLAEDSGFSRLTGRHKISQHIGFYLVAGWSFIDFKWYLYVVFCRLLNFECLSQAIVVECYVLLRGNVITNNFNLT